MSNSRTEEPQIFDCVVIGAGLSGLTAAYQLNKAGRSFRLVDAAKKVGGVIQTIDESPYQIEAGPNTFLSTAVEINQLIEELGLETLPASPQAKDRFVFLNQQLNPVPTSLISFLKTPLLSLGAKLNLLTEPFKARAHCEETVAAFTRRRLGEDVLNNLMTPFLTGIYAGDPEHLSMKAVFPSLWTMEQSHGSIVKGMMNKIKQAKANKNASNSAKKKPYALLSFKNGMAALPNPIAEKLPKENILLSTPCEGLVTVLPADASENSHQQFIEIRLSNGQSLVARSVILATPASVSSKLMASLSLPELSHKTLTNINYAPMVVAHLAFKKTDFNQLPQGFGFLVPRTEKIQLLGAIYTSCLFPERCPDDEVLVTCFLGGALNPDAIDYFDDAVVDRIVKDLIKTANLSRTASPVFQTIIRWPNAIPQYMLGHVERVNDLEAVLRRQYPQIQLAGNYLKGVSVNDCVKSGQAAYEQTSSYLSQTKEREPQTTAILF